jgi:hypothetical protein
VRIILRNTFVTESIKDMCDHKKKLLELFTNAVSDTDVKELRMKGEERFINSGKTFWWEGKDFSYKCESAV